jgi:hypothetical protein
MTNPTATAAPSSNGQAAAAPNPFDPARLRLSQDFASHVAVKKVLTVVPCRKPSRHEWVRVYPSAEWRLETGLFEDKVNRETYLVEPALWGELIGEIHPACLFYAITRQNDVMLWPVKLPGADGKSNTWNDSALAAARLAEKQWTRMSANMAAGQYDTFAAASELAEPEWPTLSFQEVLQLAFKSRFIQTLEHPAIKALRGEV